jgi:hypothetical protein
VYAAYLLIVAAFSPVPRPQRVRVVVGGAALALLAFGLPEAPSGPLLALARDLMPVAYILACYHLSGALCFEPQPVIETRFATFDARVQRLFGMPGSIARAPRLVAEYLEASYFACYLAIPAGYAAIVAAGSDGDIDRYWSLVLLSVLSCYAMLPWIRTRAPWSLEAPGPMDRRPVLLRDLNRFCLRYASIQVNTFPSGHTAAALAAALAVTAVWPAAGALFLIVAVSVAVATVVGRYHYAGDTVAAVTTTLAVWAVVSFAGR